MSSSYVSPFSDDPGHPGEEILYRRIPNQWIDWTVNEDSPRIRRAAFQDYSPRKAMEMGYPGACMSVGLSSVLEEQGRVPEELLEGWGDAYGLASVTAGDV